MIDNINSADKNFCVERENRLNNSYKMSDETDNFQEPNRDIFYRPGDYAYAQCTKVTNNGYLFRCIDKYSSFFLPDSLIRKLSINIEINKYYWAKLGTEFKQSENNCQYSNVWLIADTSKSHIVKEINQFARSHRRNDLIYAYIKEKNPDYILVSITPNFTVKITANVFGDQYSCYNNDNIKKFKIVNIVNKEDGKIFVKMKPILHDTIRDELLWNMLPRTMDASEVVIPSKIIETIKDRELCSLFVTNHASSDKDVLLNPKGLALFLNEKYKIAYDSKRLTVRENKKYYFMEFDTQLKDNKGVPIFACFKKNKEEKHGKWICNLIGFTTAEREFEKYVYVDNWQKLLDELCNIVLKGENWDLPGENEQGKHFILKQYLKFTFYKVHLDRAIIEENGNAIFDTGLVDQSYDNVYCFLRKNENDDDFYKRDWSFGFFAAWGKGDNGKRINGLFTNKPNPPKYIDKLENIFYDTDIELYCDYEHIILDNLDRLPLEFLKRKLYYDVQFQEIVIKFEDARKATERIKIMADIKQYIRSDFDEGGNACTDIQFGLQRAVETAQKYCKWNYKTAIPIYYPRTNGISLLLPLCLTNNDNRADVALVIEKLESGNYQGQTILTLDMAYQDARLICRPNSEWLTPENIETYHNIEDDLDNFDE